MCSVYLWNVKVKKYREIRHYYLLLSKLSVKPDIQIMNDINRIMVELKLSFRGFALN